MTPELEAKIRFEHSLCPPSACYRRVLLDEIDAIRIEREKYRLAIVRFCRAGTGGAIVKALDHLRVVVGMPKKDKKAAGV